MSEIQPQLGVGKMYLHQVVVVLQLTSSQYASFTSHLYRDSLNLALLGVLAVQVYIHTLSFKKDQKVNKLVVAFIFVAEIL
ncbi:hypothetical protein DFH06DRAFT_1319413 [Mycena polygramma]|nr:hypothetical protein DFH06DRAFT_1319413 [Mycena polygramma]